MKKLLFLLLFLFPVITNAQISAAANVSYSSKFKAGIGPELGYYFNNKFYVGTNATVYPFHPKNSTVIPVAFQFITGIRTRNIQFFISGGHLSTGHETISEHEGFSTFTFGGGISYIIEFNKRISGKITIGTKSYNINTIIAEEVCSELKNGHFQNFYITFSYGIFGKGKNDDEALNKSY